MIHDMAHSHGIKPHPYGTARISVAASSARLPTEHPAGVYPVKNCQISAHADKFYLTFQKAALYLY